MFRLWVVIWEGRSWKQMVFPHGLIWIGPLGLQVETSDKFGPTSFRSWPQPDTQPFLHIDALIIIILTANVYYLRIHPFIPYVNCPAVDFRALQISDRQKHRRDRLARPNRL